MSSSGKSEAGGLAPPEASRWVPGGWWWQGLGVSLSVSLQHEAPRVGALLEVPCL